MEEEVAALVRRRARIEAIEDTGHNTFPFAGYRQRFWHVQSWLYVVFFLLSTSNSYLTNRCLRMFAARSRR